MRVGEVVGGSGGEWVGGGGGEGGGEGGVGGGGFFFSSRRRHTRSLCDWSSDVCSSDPKAPAGSFMIGSPARVVEKPVPAEALEEPVRSYRARAKRFAAELRPLDYEPGRSIHPDPQGAQNGD